MNKSLLFAFLLAITPLAIMGQNSNESQTANHVSEIIVGSLIGAGAGAICALVDSKFPDALPITWLASMLIRNAVVADCSKNMKTNGSTMSLFSFLSAWMVYCKMYPSLAYRTVIDVGLFGKIYLKK